MKKLYFYLSLVVSMLIITSCSSRIIDFTIISTKNIDLSRTGNFQRARMRTQGSDVAHFILIFPIGNPNMKEAIDQALQKIPGAVALVDGVVYYKYWWAFLYGQRVYVVEGTPLIDPTLGMVSKPLPDYMSFKFDNKGNIQKYKILSEENYLTLKSKIIKSEKNNASTSIKN